MPLNDLAGVSDMVPAVREAMKKDDKLYVVPLRFKIPCLMGISEVVEPINSIEDLMAYQAEHRKEPLLDNFGIKGLYHKMAKLTSKSWVNTEGQPSQEELGQFLEGIKLLHDFYGFEQEEEAIYTNEIHGNIFDHVPLGLYDMRDCSGPAIVGGITEIKTQTKLKSITEEGKVCFEPIDLVAINRNTKEAKCAAECLSYMLQEESQMQDITEGFPTNQSALDKGLQKQLEGIGGVTWVDKDGRSFYINYRSQLMYPQFREILNQLALPVMGEPTLEAMIYEEAMPYFKGEKELSEVLETLSTKVALYEAG